MRGNLLRVVAVTGLANFLSGLVIGVLVGLLVSPLLRFWLTWHEWAEASREARLTEDVLERMDAGPRSMLRDRKSAETPRLNRQRDHL